MVYCPRSLVSDQIYRLWYIARIFQFWLAPVGHEESAEELEPISLVEIFLMDNKMIYLQYKLQCLNNLPSSIYMLQLFYIYIYILQLIFIYLLF